MSGSKFPKLYNTGSRTVDEIDDQDALHTALASGTHSFEAGAAIDVTSPSGERGTIPAENIGEAIKAGFKVETPTQRAVREYTEANQGLKGDLKVGLGQLADEALMGLPELIFDKTADPLQVAKKEALKKEHELANTLGGITGFGTSMFVGGPLFKGAAKAGEKVTAHVAEKLAVQAGEEVGKRTINRAAKDVLKRMTASGAGGAVEGAIVSAPHAITEAALGDPDDAAETLMAGIGIGSVFGAGGVLAKDLLKLGKDGIVKGASLITDQEETAKSLARKAAKVLTGVGEDDILHYLQNADRVNAAPAREAIKDMIDAGVSKKAAVLEASKENLGRARGELESAYRESRFQLGQKTAPEGLAREIMGEMDNVKAVLGSLSEQADDALERSGLSFRRDDLLKFLDDVGGAIGVKGKGGERVLVSDEAVAATNKLFAQRERLASLPDDIDATTLRGILREVRQDIKWNQLAGEFNDTLNKARKKFQEGISGVLKDKVPEYNQYMGRMRSLSENLEKMVPVFGDEKRAVGALNKLQTPTGKVNERILQEFGEINGRNFLAELDDFNRSKELYQLAGRQDVSDRLNPELYAKVKRLEAEVAQAEAAYAPVKRLSDARSQAVIRNQGFKNASIEDRRALEALSEAEGQNFLELIRDRNVLDAFGKESTNGSRKTLLGAILGGVGGGPLGGAVGGAVGATADVYGAQILKKLLDANRNVSGLLFSEKAMKQAAEKLDDIPHMLGRMAKKAKPKAARAKSTYAITRLLTGSEPTGASEAEEAKLPTRTKRLEDLNDKAAILVSNPAALSEKLAELTMPISGGGAPGIGEALSRKMSAGMGYLYAQMPKAPRPRSPFAPKAIYRPSDSELRAFEDKVQAVSDPFSVLSELEHGTLTRHHVDALKAVYPGLHRMIQMKVQDAVINGVEPLPYKERAKLSLLLDAPMDTSMTGRAVAYYQEAYAAADAAAVSQESGGGEFRAQVNVSAGAMTEMDRIAAKS